MMPTEDAAWVGAGARAPLRPRRSGRSRSRRPTPTAGRSGSPARSPAAPKILVFAWCYHGSVDEAFALPATDGAVARPGNVGPPGRRSPQTTRVAEFNDAEQLERGARPRRRRRRPDGAGAHQHRHRAARAGLPRDGRAGSRASTARCSSTTRRTPSAPARAAPRAPGASTRTSSRSARRSPAACPSGAFGISTELAERIAADARRRPGRHRRRRRHPGRQRALAGRHPRHARARPHRRRVRRA